VNHHSYRPVKCHPDKQLQPLSVVPHGTGSRFGGGFCTAVAPDSPICRCLRVRQMLGIVDSKA
jgi:hypothetical protein